jgi:2-alkenal reductase
VQHAFLGISGISITPDLARAVNLPAEQGVLVQEVVKGGPADEAGLEGGTTSATLNGANLTLGGDIIGKVNGKKISGMEDVINVVNGAKPGDKLEVTVVRRGSSKTVTVTLGARPTSAQAGSPR